jgi:hypothetical protein
VASILITDIYTVAYNINHGYALDVLPVSLQAVLNLIYVAPLVLS